MDKKDKTEKIEKVAKKNIKKQIKKIIKPKKKEETPIISTEPFLENVQKIKEKRNKKLMNKLELIVIFVFSIIMLILLCNRTFFRRNYKTSKININLPLLMFFKSDDGNKLVLKTIRKSQYVKDYFDDKLNNMAKYSCNGYTFYYDEDNFYAIYDVKIEKDFIVKTVTIEYASGDANCLCNANATGKKAEMICNR